MSRRRYSDRAGNGISSSLRRATGLANAPDDRLRIEAFHRSRRQRRAGPLHKDSSYSAKAEYPVRCGFSLPSLASLDYWIARLRGRRRVRVWRAFAPNELLGIHFSNSDNNSVQNRHCEERSDEAIHSSFTRRHGLLRFARNDVALVPHTTSRSRGTLRPRFAFISRPHRGRGECRVPVAPAASCALCIGRKHTSNNEYTGTPGIPARNGFNSLCRALPGDRALLPPSSAD